MTLTFNTSAQRALMISVGPSSNPRCRYQRNLLSTLGMLEALGALTSVEDGAGAQLPGEVTGSYLDITEVNVYVTASVWAKYMYGRSMGS